MKSFDYLRADALAAVHAQALQPGTKILAGGTTLLDLMKLGVECPARVFDITRLAGMDAIVVTADVIRIGALAKMAKVADHAGIRHAAPAISESLWRAASAQLRNMASIGGNLMQRTRCTYFRDPGAYANCNKRNPGSGCAAIGGVNRNHAILGVSSSCIATYHGDLAVALAAFDARIIVSGSAERSIAIDDFFLLPGATPHLENTLQAGELIVAIEIPRSKALQRSHYLKVRDRASYEFAAASAAVGLELDADGRTIREVRIAIGGVATRPWRLRAVEAVLKGQPYDEATLRAAAAGAVSSATSSGHNAYKIDLAPRVVARALMHAGGMA